LSRWARNEILRVEHRIQLLDERSVLEDTLDVLEGQKRSRGLSPEQREQLEAESLEGSDGLEAIRKQLLLFEVDADIAAPTA